MAAVADLYLRPLRTAMFERAQPLAAKKVRVVVSEMADTVNLIGCARLAWEADKSAHHLAPEMRRSSKKHSRTKKEKK